MKFPNVDMDALEQELIAIRRDLHKYPESGWTEFRTTALIISELEKLGLTVRFGPELHVPEKMHGMPDPEVLEACWERAMKETDRPDLVEKMRGGFTGCITEIRGALPGPTVGIRVDIDCNDVEESCAPEHVPAALGFRSTHKNCMHACGHDSHTAIGIGTAKLLCAHRDQLKGKVLLVFQPGEEGLRGAASMTAAGLFSDCDYFLGAHVGLIAGEELGTVYASGHNFLSSTKFDVTIHGFPAHAGASPEQGKNALAAAATAVLNMLAIPRHRDGASRINIGSLQSGTGRNVIPGEAKMMVETRGATAEINAYMEEKARRVCQAAAEMYDCTCSIRFMGSAGDITCDPELVDRVMEILPGVEGVKKVKRDAYFGGGEDVTTMMRDVQAHGGKVTEMIFCMPLKAPHHNDFFDVDEKVIGLGARVFASVAMEVEK